MSNVLNELVITGSIRKANDELSGDVTFELTTTGDVSIPDVIGDDPFDGPYEVEPTFKNQVLKTRTKTMIQDLKVLKIRTYQTSNRYGTTFIV